MSIVSSVAIIIFYPIGIWISDKQLKSQKYTPYKIIVLTFIGYSLFGYFDELNIINLFGLLFVLNMIGFFYQDVKLLGFKTQINLKLRILYMLSVYAVITIIWNGCILYLMLVSKEMPSIAAKGIVMISMGFVALTIINFVENISILRSKTNVVASIRSFSLAYLLPVIIILCAMWIIFLSWRFYFAF